MIDVITTIASISQAEKLLEFGVNTLYAGSEKFGLRFPKVFFKEEIEHLTQLAHSKGAKMRIGVNAIMHSSDIGDVVAYLDFLSKIAVDEITVGDTGVIHLIEEHDYSFSYIYAGETLVTSARQMNFYGKHGATGAVVASEVPFEELKIIYPKLTIVPEILVYGASCIHHSLRPLLSNYFEFIEQQEDVLAKGKWYISDPENPNSHYSIFEDNHGTHIYATDDISLMNELLELYKTGYNHWLLEGIFLDEAVFNENVSLFLKARDLIVTNQWTIGTATALQNNVKMNHPNNRGLSTGFYYLSSSEIS